MEHVGQGMSQPGSFPGMICGFDILFCPSSSPTPICQESGLSSDKNRICAGDKAGQALGAWRAAGRGVFHLFLKGRL
jgi:hypothetical protein